MMKPWLVAALAAVSITVVVTMMTVASNQEQSALAEQVKPLKSDLATSQITRDVLVQLVKTCFKIEGEAK